MTLHHGGSIHPVAAAANHCEEQGASLRTAQRRTSSFTAEYAYGNGLIRKDGEYPMFDGLGSARTTCNSSQTVTATATYEGFGATIASTGSTGSKYGFAATSGYRNDGDAGLMHVGARYCDPQVGRFVTRDTDLEEHPYLYCEHDPSDHVDPSGHNWVDVVSSTLSLIFGIEFPRFLILPDVIPPSHVSPPPPWWNNGKVPPPETPGVIMGIIGSIGDKLISIPIIIFPRGYLSHPLLGGPGEGA